MTDRRARAGGGRPVHVMRILCWGMVMALAGWTARGEFVVDPVKSFGVPDQVGANSSATMIIGSDGAFYGTTYAGGGAVRGTVYRLSSDGTELRVLHRFTGLSGDGAKVYSGVIEASNGMLYGTTGEGGTSDKGTIYRLRRDGSDYEVLYSFTGAAGDGSQAFAGLTEASDGWLYGTTRYGGNANKGTVYKLRLDGTGYSVVHHFSGTHAGGAEPVARVIEGPGARLYGATFGATVVGAVTNQGTLFSLGLDGTGHTLLRAFTGQGGDGANPYADLLLASDGMLYGTTAFGGTTNQGVLFRINTDGSGYERLRSFDRSANGGSVPYGPVMELTPGTLMGTTSFGGTNRVGIIYTVQTDGSGYDVLRHFVGDAVDGGVPYGGLLKGADGALYGTTWYGGPPDHGTIYKLEEDGSDYEVVQYLKGGSGGPVEAWAGLVLGADGYYYGTSWFGGISNRGTVYRMKSDTREIQVLHSFSGGPTGAEHPYGGVIVGSDGVLYGTTVEGGTQNLGTFYKLNRDGTGFAILRNFVSANSGGYFPYAGLLEGSDGLIYGATVSGGSAGYGIVFRINKSGGNYSVLRAFRGGTDGANPYSTLIEGSDGWLYGATAFGGGENRGTVFRMRRGGGDYSVLRRFTGSEDGAQVYGRLLEGSDGQLYGATSGGGRSGSGTVFRLGKNGSNYASLYQFDGTAAQPLNALGGLVQGFEGLLYGTSSQGGQWGQGTLFRLNLDGSGFSVVHHFRGESGDGAHPSGELVLGHDGLWYGTSRYGGLGSGAIYRLAPLASLSLESDGQLRLTGQTGFTYMIEGSAEATGAGPWETLSEVQLTNSPALIPVPGYGTSSKQFYRTRLAP